MELAKAKKAYWGLSIAFVVYTLAYGVIAIALFWTCYFTGKETGKPYADGRAAQFLMYPLLPMLFVWIALIVVLGVFYRLAKQKETIAPIQCLYQKYRMFRSNVANLSEDGKKEYGSAKRSMVLLASICGAVSAICLAMGILFFCLFHFDASLDATSQTINVLAHVLPWVVGIFASISIFAIFGRKSFEKMITVLSAAPRGEKKTKKRTALLWAIRGVVLVGAIALIVLGAMNDGAAAVIRKATAICMECLGIG